MLVDPQWIKVITVFNTKLKIIKAKDLNLVMCTMNVCNGLNFSQTFIFDRMSSGIFSLNKTILQHILLFISFSQVFLNKTLYF